VVVDDRVPAGAAPGLEILILDKGAQLVAAQPAQPVPVAGEVEPVGELRAIRVAVERVGDRLVDVVDEGAEEARIGPAIEQVLVHVDLQNRLAERATSNDVAHVAIRLLAEPAELNKRILAPGRKQRLIEQHRSDFTLVVLMVGRRQVDARPIVDCLGGKWGKSFTSGWETR
jgi:hypothetical protein